ncbi:GNAT family N-acetyltransferase [Thorsellia kenyensis]|uniref:GNAT family N-acetyltransferase n=1 Tax=Thorsellia kenyensis TaxID=1549888 RepID=A0ABV6C6H7_9GAMM
MSFINMANPWPLVPLPLYSDKVHLVPLALEHAVDLKLALEENDLWNFWLTPIPTVSSLEKEIKRRLSLQNEGKMFPYSVYDVLKNRYVGMTTLMELDRDNQRLEIGYTWYSKSSQKTIINTQAKYLLLEYAFSELNVIAVEFRTHFFNHASRRAIERLGAKLDGVLRNHRITLDDEGNRILRDTCVYSIIQSEWPTVKQHLRYKLNNYVY